jgi:hypothetical protein
MPKTTQLQPLNNVVPLNAFDPDQVNARLYKQVSVLLKQLETEGEELPIKERIAAMMAIGRLQDLFGKMRKGQGDVGAGSNVRKYEGTFASNAGRGRENGGGDEAEPDGDDWFEQSDRDA